MYLAWILSNGDQELGLLGRTWTLLNGRPSGSQGFQSSILSLSEARSWQIKSVLLGALGFKYYSTVLVKGGPDQNEMNPREALVECAICRLAIIVF